VCARARIGRARARENARASRACARAGQNRKKVVQVVIALIVLIF
jgi:hypothetical protein